MLQDPAAQPKAAALSLFPGELGGRLGRVEVREDSPAEIKEV